MTHKIQAIHNVLEITETKGVEPYEQAQAMMLTTDPDLLYNVLENTRLGKPYHEYELIHLSPMLGFVLVSYYDRFGQGLDINDLRDLTDHELETLWDIIALWPHFKKPQDQFWSVVDRAFQHQGV